MQSKERFRVRASVYLLPVKGNEVLLLRRYNTGWMDGMYSLISGHIDGNESISTAMQREAAEEAKIQIHPKDLIPATVLHRKSPDQEYVDFFYIIKKWQGEPTIGEPDKCDALRWVPIDALPENTLPYIKVVILNYKNKTSFSEYGWDLVKDAQPRKTGQ